MLEDSTHMTGQESSDTSASESLFRVAHVLLSQVVQLLEQSGELALSGGEAEVPAEHSLWSVTTDDQLTHASTLIPGSTIGKHLRHTHDHFRLLLDSLRTSSPSTPLLLSYDTRSRNVASENSHAASLESFRSLRRRLEEETCEGAIDSARRVLLEAVTPERVDLESSWAREVGRRMLPAASGD